MAKTFVIKSTVLGNAIRKNVKTVRVQRFGSTIEFIPADQVVLVDRIIDSSQKEIEDLSGLFQRASKDAWTTAAAQQVISYAGGHTYRTSIPKSEVMVISHGCPAVAARWAVRFL